MTVTKVIRLRSRPNIWGATASVLCLIHCLATPFLFVAHMGHVQGQHSSPAWWGFLDILFLVISFLAVFWSVRNTSKTWIKWSLWSSWAVLAGIILNEKIAFIPLSEELIYAPSVALVVLHLYNRKYCQCGNEGCCTTDAINTKK